MFDLLVEFDIDQFEKKPIEVHRNAQGEIQFTDTGDELIDKWEAQIAKGEIPDLYEAFDEQSLAHVERIRQAARDRDPYQGLSMKSAFDKLQREAAREGLHIGPKPQGMTPDQQRQLEALFKNPTFGEDLDD